MEYLLALNLIARGRQAIQPAGNVAHAWVQSAAPGEEHHSVLKAPVVFQGPGLNYTLQEKEVCFNATAQRSTSPGKQGGLPVGQLEGVVKFILSHLLSFTSLGPT